MLIVEDLEHSDPGTREFIGTLMRTTRRLPVALVVGYHPDEIRRGHPARDFVDALDDAIAGRRADRAWRRSTAEEIGDAGRGGAGRATDAGASSRHSTRVRAAIRSLAEQLVAAQQQLAASRLSDPLDEIVDARLDELDEAQTRVLRRARRCASAADAPPTLARLTLPGGHLPRNAVGSRRAQRAD